MIKEYSFSAHQILILDYQLLYVKSLLGRNSQYNFLELISYHLVCQLIHKMLSYFSHIFIIDFAFLYVLFLNSIIFQCLIMLLIKYHLFYFEISQIESVFIFVNLSHFFNFKLINLFKIFIYLA
jgi:hypothetical protein